jgi:tetratricopeptide (TPR) repeat protein
MWRFWQQRGYLNEARSRFESLDSMGWDLDPVDRARFAEAFGGVAYWQSDQPIAARWYDEALGIWREQGDRREIANALYNRAYADMIIVMSGPAEPSLLHASRVYLNEALDIYRELGDRMGEGNVLWGMGGFSYFTSDAATAESMFEQSLALHREAGNRTMEAWSLHMLALAKTGQGEYDRATETARHALRHFHEAGDVSGVLLVLDDLAIIAINQGQPERAGRLWGAARHLQSATGAALADYVEIHQQLFGIPAPHDVLSPEELERFSRDGAAMSLDEIVAYALEDDPPADDDIEQPG